MSAWGDEPPAPRRSSTAVIDLREGPPAPSRRAEVRIPPAIATRTVGGLGPVHRLGALAAATTGVVLGLRPFADNSFLTHVATGRVILDEQAMPREDVYSFTAEHVPWVVQSWLPSVLYALADRLGGGAGLLVLRALVTTALSLLLWRLTRSASSFGARLTVLLGVTVACAHLWSPRPLLIGLALFALSAVVAEEERLPAWWLVPIGWVWANSHGTFPLLLGYLVLRALGRRLDGRSTARSVRLLGCAAAGIAVGAVGPLGLKALWFPIHLLGRSSQLDAIVEWRSPSFSDPPNAVFLVLALAAVVLPKRRRWEDLLPAAAFFALACTGLRHIPFAAVVLTPALARAVPLRSGGERSWRPMDSAMAALLALTVALVGVVQLQRDAYDLRTYPAAELGWMADHGLDTKAVRVALPDYVGNYLTWRDGPEANVFFDDRFDMYPGHVIEAHRVLFAGERGWDEALDRYEIEAVLWPANLALAELVEADARWQVVHRTDHWLVATRR